MENIKENITQFLLEFGFEDGSTYNYKLVPSFSSEINIVDGYNTYFATRLEYDTIRECLDVIYTNQDDERDFFPETFDSLKDDEKETLNQMVYFIIETT